MVVASTPEASMRMAQVWRMTCGVAFLVAMVA
jgi:hypothetical protein